MIVGCLVFGFLGWCLFGVLVLGLMTRLGLLDLLVLGIGDFGVGVSVDVFFGVVLVGGCLVDLCWLVCFSCDFWWYGLV